MTRLTSFLTDKAAFFQKVICFKGVRYPFLFTRACAADYARQQGLSFAHQHMNVENSVAAIAALQTTFLGAHFCYWLGSFDELSKSKQKIWTAFLSQYEGPHTLLFFSSAFFGAKVAIVELPDYVDISLFQKITDMVQKKVVSFRGPLFRHTDTLSLDESYLLVQYDTVLGKGSAEFVRDWLPDIIVPELSLFSLSQAFFDRKASSFFARWRQLASRYAAPFWITFWSEQLWRAYCYVRFQKMGKHAEAKKIGYRLPFSLLHRTRCNYTLDELKAQHAFLYDIDYQVKNGGSAYALDLFYASFFQD